MGIERTEETKAINAQLKVVRVKDRRFDLDQNRYILVSGYVLEHPTLGVLGWKDTDHPYQPSGGEQTLQSILDEGGFTSFELTRWWK